MNNNSTVLSNWKDCTREEICLEKLGEEMYRHKDDDPEYFENWIEKYTMLCMSKAFQGFFASCYFLGIMVSMYKVPRYSDENGRLLVMRGSLLLQLAAMTGLLVNNNLYMGYFCMFCIGVTFPGKNVIFYNYIMEMMNTKSRETAVMFITIVEAINVIAVTMFYEYLSHNWENTCIIGIFFTILSICLTFKYLPESPKFLYSKGRFTESRECLMTVAEFNKVNTKHDFEFVFDTEIINTDPLNCSRDQDSFFINDISASNFQGRDDVFHYLTNETDHESQKVEQPNEEDKLKKDRQFATNLLKMTVFWSSTSFISYMLTYLNKYLEGTIYLNNYSEGCAGLFSIILGAPIYATLGKKNSFIIAFTTVMLSAMAIFSLESGLIDMPESYLSEFQGMSRKSQVSRALDDIVPKLIFFAKFGINLSYYTCY